MSNIKKYAVAETAVLHLKDPNDELMFADGEDGKPDQSKPMRVHLYGPGSKQFNQAAQAKQNRAMQKVRRGKTEVSSEENIRETAEFLAACTASLENIEYEGVPPAEMARAIYADRTLGFIADQVNRHLGDWQNFTKGSTPS